MKVRDPIHARRRRWKYRCHLFLERHRDHGTPFRPTTAVNAGSWALVQSTALDYAAKGIRINALMPGTTDTGLVRRPRHGKRTRCDLGNRCPAMGKVPCPGLKNGDPRGDRGIHPGLASQDHPYMTGAQMVSTVAKPPTQVECIAKDTAYAPRRLGTIANPPPLYKLGNF